MSNQITLRDLEGVCKRINRVTDSPETAWTLDSAGKLRANIGNYHLDGAHGGYALHRMTNKGGGVSDIFGGHFPKRDLYYRMHAFLAGIETATNN